MGRFKQLVDSPTSMEGFRAKYSIPPGVVLEYYPPDWVLTDRRVGEVVIPLIAFIEGGMTLPMGRITRDYLRNHRLTPHQCAPTYLGSWAVWMLSTSRWVWGLLGMMWFTCTSDTSSAVRGTISSPSPMSLDWYPVSLSQIRAWRMTTLCLWGVEWRSSLLNSGKRSRLDTLGLGPLVRIFNLLSHYMFFIIFLTFHLLR